MERNIIVTTALRERFQRPDCLRFLPNLDAMLCRVAMYEGDEDAVDRWYGEKAPKDLQKLRVMVKIAYGDFQEALLAMAPLRTCFTACHRVMDLLCLDLLTAVCAYRARDGGWKTPLGRALDTCLEYRFVRPVSQYSAAILPLLEDCGWTGGAAFLDRLTAAARMQAAQMLENFIEKLSPFCCYIKNLKDRQPLWGLPAFGSYRAG